MTQRCGWCGDDPLYVRYHDEEWGVPLHDDRALFALLMLEGAQAGLSWITVLRKRKNYFAAFDNFDAAKIARYDAQDVVRLMSNAGIVRNRLKIEGVIASARAYLDVMEKDGAFDAYLWQFVDDRPVTNRWHSLDQVPASTPTSDRMSKALRQRGFKFVGSTICYAFMQASGMVNDHLTSCYRHQEICVSVCGSTRSPRTDARHRSP